MTHNTFEQIQQQTEALSEALGQFSQIIGKPAAEVVQAARTLWYQVYLENGAPFGETEEGFQRWIEGAGKAVSDD